ncbi:MAG: Sortilin, neurotensin receptor 3, partial [Myxococcales bacterium]|nr:Sortilin, neurotensin receptor 3 [Myxococcales bacterium]
MAGMRSRPGGLRLGPLALLAGAATAACGQTGGPGAGGGGGTAPGADIATAQSACQADSAPVPTPLARFTPAAVGDLVPHPRTAGIVYAVRPVHLSASLSVSVDGGRTFCPIASPTLRWLRIAPSDPRVLYGQVDVDAVGTPGALAVSRDAGRTWEMAAPPPGPVVLVDPHQAEVLVALPASQSTDRLPISTDFGRTWRNVHEPADGWFSITDAAFDPSVSGRLYVAASCFIPNQ